MFFYASIILLHLISSFWHTRSLLVPYTYVSIESIDCILLSLLVGNAISLASSVNTLCFSFLIFVVILTLIYYFYEFFMLISNIIHIKIFFLNGVFDFQVELLLNNAFNLQTDVFVLRRTFLCLWLFLNVKCFLFYCSKFFH